MKTKIFFFLAAMLLISTGAFAQSESTLKGDVNEDGKVDVADINAVIKIMKDAGGTAEAPTYYWYVGQTDPSTMSSISPIVPNTDMSSPGWRLIGTTIPTYTMANPLWNGQVNEIVFDNYNDVTAYIALPNSTIKVRDGFGNDVTSQLIPKGTKTIDGVIYTIYQNNLGNSHAMECSLDLLVY